jgi:hypothetical protein
MTRPELDARNSNLRPDTFFEAVSKLFNSDKLFITEAERGWFHTVSSLNVVRAKFIEDVIHIFPLPCSKGMPFPLLLQSKKLWFSCSHQSKGNNKEVVMLHQWVPVYIPETQQQEQDNNKAYIHLDVTINLMRTMMPMTPIYFIRAKIIAGIQNPNHQSVPTVRS